jgi:transcriptional regulator with XRE-family HTH domain
MNQRSIAKNLKGIRKKKGKSQEELAEASGLSLRTIQRIEANETIPRGDSLQKIATALSVSLEELADGSMEEDQDFLKWLNLSSLSFLVFPLLGIIVPLVIWIPRKSRTYGALQLGRSLLNFQLTWVIFLFFGYMAGSLFMVRGISMAADISPGVLSPGIRFLLLYVGSMYVYNFILIVVNASTLNKNGRIWYGPAIAFIR